MSVILRVLTKLFVMRVSVFLLFRLFQNIRLHLRKLKMVIELAGNFNLSQWEVLPFTRCILHLNKKPKMWRFFCGLWWLLFLETVFFKLLTFRSKNFKVYLKTSIVFPAYLTLKKKKRNYCLDILNFLRMYWREKKNELYRIQNIVKALLRNNTCERLLKYTYNLLRKENFQSKAH